MLSRDNQSLTSMRICCVRDSRSDPLVVIDATGARMFPEKSQINKRSVMQ